MRLRFDDFRARCLCLFRVYGKALSWLCCSESVCAELTSVSRGSSCNLRGCPIFSTAVHLVSIYVPYTCQYVAISMYQGAV